MSIKSPTEECCAVRARAAVETVGVRRSAAWAWGLRELPAARRRKQPTMLRPLCRPQLRANKSAVWQARTCHFWIFKRRWR